MYKIKREFNIVYSLYVKFSLKRFVILQRKTKIFSPFFLHQNENKDYILLDFITYRAVREYSLINH